MIFSPEVLDYKCLGQKNFTKDLLKGGAKRIVKKSLIDVVVYCFENCIFP
jgi:hypothetical protein